MGKGVIFVSLILLVAILVGCQQNTNKSLSPNNISMITISTFQGFGQISDDIILTITDKQE